MNVLRAYKKDDEDCELPSVLVESHIDVLVSPQRATTRS